MMDDKTNLQGKQTMVTYSFTIQYKMSATSSKFGFRKFSIYQFMQK
jgi:hypothetical protein